MNPTSATSNGPSLLNLTPEQCANKEQKQAKQQKDWNKKQK